MKINKQIGRRDYLRRHARTFLPHLTPGKAVNIARNLNERKGGVASPRSLPPYLKIETTPLCQLKCPGCEKSVSNLSEAAPAAMKMTPNQFRSVLGPLVGTTVGISLCNQGEPLLNENLEEMIACASGWNIAVSFPTNLSLSMDGSRLERLVDSGLDCLYVSLDGASPGSYGKYRIGGDFGLVRENVLALHEVRRRRGKKTPRLVWKFVQFPHNKGEVEVVRRDYKAWGFDAYEIVWNNRSREYRDTKTEYRQRRADKGRSCFWPWHVISVRWDGVVSPCCSSLDFGLGNAIEEDLREIWRSQAFTDLRAGLADGTGRTPLHPVCASCLGRNRA